MDLGPAGPQYGPPGTGPHTRYEDITGYPPGGYAAAYYGQAPAQANVTNIHLGGRRVNHVLHAIMTVLSCGLWTPVWIWDALRR